MGHEIDTEAAEFIERHDKLLGAARKAVEPPDDHSVNDAPAGVCHQGIQAGPTLLGATGSVGVYLVQVPAPACDEFPEGLFLDCGVLIVALRFGQARFLGCRNPDVDSGPCRLAVTVI